MERTLFFTVSYNKRFNLLMGRLLHVKLTRLSALYLVGPLHQNTPYNSLILLSLRLDLFYLSSFMDIVVNELINVIYCNLFSSV
jgi:hypothetical protein